MHISKYIFFSLLSFAYIHQAQSKEIKIAGGAAPMQNIFFRIKADFESKTGHKLILQEVSPELALKSLSEGSVDAAAAGVSWQDWLLLCKEKNIKIDESIPYRYQSISRDIIKVYVNSSSDINSLSNGQLKQIFTGEIKNWKEVGGPDQPIKIVYANENPGINMTFKRQILEGSDFKKDIIVDKADSVAQAIATNAGAIGLGPAGMKIEKFSIKALETKEIIRPVLFVFVSVSPKMVQLKNYLLSDGKSLSK